MRAGYLLDFPVAGQPFTGVPGQVSTTHGTQHTDMSYSYVQRGGAEEFHPFDYLGFRYFQIDDPGEVLAPADVVALARHTAPPTLPPATFTSDQPLVDTEFQLGAHSALFTAQEQYIDTPTREKGSWLYDGFNESAHGHGRLRRAEPHPQVAAGVRPVPGALLAQRRGQQDLPHRARRARHQRVDRGLCRMGVAVLDVHRRPGAPVDGVRRARPHLRLRPAVGGAPDRPGDEPAGHQRLLQLPGGDPAQRPRGQRLPPHGGGGRGAGAAGARGGPPAGSGRRPDLGHQPAADPAGRDLLRRPRRHRQPDPDRLPDGQCLCGQLRGRAGAPGRLPWPAT